MPGSRVILVGHQEPGILSKRIVLQFIRSALERVSRLEECPNSDFDRQDTCPIIDFNRACLADPPRGPVAYLVHGSAPRGLVDLLLHADRIRPQDILVVTCRRDAEIVGAYLPHARVHILQLPASDAFFAAPGRSQARQRLRIPAQELVLAYVARLHPLKRLDAFLRVAARVAIQTRQSITLLVVGDPQRYKRFDWQDPWSFVADSFSNVHSSLRVQRFCGSLAAVDLACIYAAADVLVHPTQMPDENYGLVAVEAQASGTPVVATGWGGLHDIVMSPISGGLVTQYVTAAGPRFSESQMAACVLDTLVPRGSAIELGEHADQHSFRRFVDDVRQLLAALATCDPSHSRVSHAQRPESSSARWKQQESMDRVGTFVRLHHGGTAEWQRILPFVSRYGNQPPRFDPSMDWAMDRIEIRQDCSAFFADPVWKSHFWLREQARAALSDLSRGLPIHDSELTQTLDDLVSLGLLAPT